MNISDMKLKVRNILIYVQIDQHLHIFAII